MTNILFICKYNRFRSKLAEAYFKKINKDKTIHVKSAGLFRGSYPLSESQVRVAKKFGIHIKGRPQGLSTELLKWSDYQVIVADNVPKSLFDESKQYGKKIVLFKIKDAVSKDTSGIERTTKDIIKHIDKFILDLEK